MKCSSCKFYQKSKMFGNHCICTGAKPCEIDHRDKRYKHLKKVHNKRKERYND